MQYSFFVFLKPNKIL